MTPWLRLILPFALVLARTSAFIGVLPLVSSRTVPRHLRVGLAVLLTVFFAWSIPPAAAIGKVKALSAAVMLAREALCGLGLGLAVRLVFVAVQQGGVLIGRQMGFAFASIVDPSSGENTQPFGLYMDTLFTLLFLVAGGHHLLLRMIGRSYQAFPIAGGPDFGVMASAVTAAGSAMLLFALKLAAPLLAAILILTVVLGVLARVLPEMNILLLSLPLRVGAGLLLAVAMVPVLETFVHEIIGWMEKLL
jgi:flagellar biosynthetic protein FliR